MADSDVSQPLPTDQSIEVVPVEVSDDSQPVERLERPAGSRIVMRQTGDSVVFEIPPTGFRSGALGMLIFACLWLTFMAIFTTELLLAKQPPGQAHLAGRIAPFAFVGVFWLVGGSLVLLAFSLARQSAAIAVAGGQYMVIQKGLFRETKQIWQAGELAAVQVGLTDGTERRSAELQFIPRRGRKFGMLAGHRHSELEWLATHLRKALHLSAGAPLADVDTQPAGSNVVFRQSGDVLTISVPRRLWRKQSAVLFMFALAWNLFVAGMVAAFWFLDQQHGVERFMVMVFFVPFVLVGIGLILAAINMAIQRAEIAIAGGRLLVVRRGVFGKRRNEWADADLRAVRAGPSTTIINNQRQIELQIVPRVGAELKLLTGHDPNELAWIATLLRRSLNLPATVEQQPPKQTAAASTAEI